MKAFQCKEPKEPSLRTIWERKYNIKCCMKVKMELNTWSSNTHIVSFKPSFDHLTSYYNLDERPSGSEREWSEIHRYEAMIKKRCFWLPHLQCRPKKWRPSGTQISSCKKKKKWKKRKQIDKTKGSKSKRKISASAEVPHNVLKLSRSNVRSIFPNCPNAH